MKMNGEKDASTEIIQEFEL